MADSPGRIGDLLRRVADLEGTDLYLLGGSPPMVSTHGRYEGVAEGDLTPADLETLARDVMSPEDWGRFRDHPEYNTARTVEGAGRFRINIYRQRTEIGIVARRLAEEIPSLQKLSLPEILGRMVLVKQGLIFVTGATGSGKSTTLAAMIDHRNTAVSGHIITIEDPIEFVHPHKKGIVSQREVGMDTESFHSALKQALRQAPEVVLIGEIRDREVAEAALHFSDTGHLVLATLHSTNATQTLERIVNFFPHDMRDQALMLLSLNLRGIVSQRLVPATGGGRAAALEILLPSPRVRDLIRHGKIEEVEEAVAASTNDGMQTFDQALLALILEERITEEDALRYANSPNDLGLRIRMERGEDDKADSICLVEENR